MKSSRFRHFSTIALIDLTIFVVCLLSFSWFHHAKNMLSDSSGSVIIGRRQDTHDTDTFFNGGDNIDNVLSPPPSSPSVHDTASAAESAESVEASVSTAAITDTDTSVTEPIETEPPVPEHRFESKFAPYGVVEKTSTSYRSHDININIDRITRLFDDSGVVSYYVIDVYVRSIDNIYTVSSDSRYFMEELCEAGGAVAAVSGDFWYKNAHIAVRGGEVLKRDNSTENDFCVMYNNGSMACFPGSALSDFTVTEDVYQVWNFGPSLLDESGEALRSFGSKNDISGTNPRSSIGYYEPGHYCFVVADGRVHVRYEGNRIKSYGITLRDLALVYEELGCVCAYNLDGGDSAYAYFDGDVIRQDYSRAHSENEEPRKIYDIICIGER